MVDVAQGRVVEELYKNLVIWDDPVHELAAVQGWISLVRRDAVWDFKPDLIRANILFSGEKRLVTLGNHDLNFQAVANIFFGFIGRASGFSEGELLLGAGIAQIKSHGIVWENLNLSQLGDQAFDVWAVKFGFYLFDLYGWDLNIYEWNEIRLLDKDAFAQALDDYIQAYGEPPELPTP